MPNSEDVGSDAHFIALGVVAEENFIVSQNQGIV